MVRSCDDVLLLQQIEHDCAARRRAIESRRSPEIQTGEAVAGVYSATCPSDVHVARSLESCILTPRYAVRKGTKVVVVAIVDEWAMVIATAHGEREDLRRLADHTVHGWIRMARPPPRDRGGRAATAAIAGEPMLVREHGAYFAGARRLAMRALARLTEDLRDARRFTTKHASHAHALVAATGLDDDREQRGSDECDACAGALPGGAGWRCALGCAFKLCGDCAAGAPLAADDALCQLLRRERRRLLLEYRSSRA